MSYELSVLLIAAASIGFFHTLFGPDHYLPFIVLSKSGNWSLPKTTLITFLCGMGNVLSSVLLGIIGVTFGMAVTKLEALESFHGNLAAWALIAFGLVYSGPPLVTKLCDDQKMVIHFNLFVPNRYRVS